MTSASSRVSLSLRRRSAICRRRRHLRHDDGGHSRHHHVNNNIGGLLSARSLPRDLNPGSSIDGEDDDDEQDIMNDGFTIYDEEVLQIETLRATLEPRPSPFTVDNNGGIGFCSDNDRIVIHSLEYASQESAGASCGQGGIFLDEETCMPIPKYALRSGPRKTIYHDPSTVRCAIVTCGGLCPGLNDVVRQLVLSLEDYGVGEHNDSTILGIYYGLGGFLDHSMPPAHLNYLAVDGIQERGGTLLGTSRGGADIPAIADQIEKMHLDMVFVIGGNGGNRAALAIHRELRKRENPKCCVIGIPKSIDNDILLIDRCFGFDTAVEQAVSAIYAANVEATSARNGVGVVKLMGRQSGYIAMYASMASGEVDLCLTPEVPFEMDGALHHIEQVVHRRGHAVVVVAEGAGQDLLGNNHNNGYDVKTDASGNPILQDIGPYIRDAIKAHFRSTGSHADVKYIDPSYIIRAASTNPADKLYCQILAQGAVHAAFSGCSGVTTGLVNGHYVWVPIETVVEKPRKVDIRGRMWARLLAMTKQPAWGTTS
ncbi:ATP-dependent 6-phosphofructokinase [Pycnococcus provasolii]